jgi:hypothetical protein
MMKARFGWKVAAVLLSIIAAAAFIGSVRKGSALLSSVELALAAIGAIQYAFDWPKIPRAVWRVFGPLFSILMIWTLAWRLGWLGTRLAVRQLNLAEQAGTIAALIVTATFGAVVFFPLYRLGDWGNKSDRRDGERLTELTDTLA